MKKKLKSLCAAAVMLATIAGTTTFAEQVSTKIDAYYVPLEFIFDGEQYAPPEDQQGFIYEGSTYVPLRFISYSLNKAVRWDGDSYTVTVEEPKDTDKISIQEYNLNTKVRNAVKRDKFDTSQLSASNVTVYKEKVNYVFNGQEKAMGPDLSGIFVDNRLYVPLRFFSESVGKKIEWDPVSYSISAKAKEETKPEPAKETEKPKEEKPAAPVTAPAGGGMGGGIGGGGASTKVSYESIITSVESKINALEMEATGFFFGLLGEYNAVTDESLKPAKKAELQGKATSKLNEYNSRFSGLMSSLRTELSANGYNDSKASEYESRYEAAKAAAMATVGLK
jgi:hypothetical protein